MTIGKRMCECRKDISIYEVSTRTGIKSSILCAYEEDILSPTLGELEQLALIYGVRMVDLLSDTDSVSIKTKLCMENKEAVLTHEDKDKIDFCKRFVHNLHTLEETNK